MAPEDVVFRVLGDGRKYNVLHCACHSSNLGALLAQEKYIFSYPPLLLLLGGQPLAYPSCAVRFIGYLYFTELR